MQKRKQKGSRSQPRPENRPIISFASTCLSSLGCSTLSAIVAPCFVFCALRSRCLRREQYPCSPILTGRTSSPKAMRMASSSGVLGRPEQATATTSQVSLSKFLVEPSPAQRELNSRFTGHSSAHHQDVL